jgi:hypothetical protein
VPNTKIPVSEKVLGLGFQDIPRARSWYLLTDGW